MKIITQIRQMQAESNKLRHQGKKIGFVPTMGALHEGHLSLIRQARLENDVVVMSIFVNPIQFGPEEDYQTYPRDFSRDEELAKDGGVEIIFYPAVEEMYPQELLTFVNVERLTDGLCGKFRPDHFRGVTTVVAKLFNIVKPHRTYFGQKDYQQAVVIKHMIEDLNFDIELVIVPIVRDSDGLALSSRNTYLSQKERASALVLSKSLQQAKELLDSGERHSKNVISRMNDLIKGEKLARVQYIEIVDSQTLEPVEIVEKEVLIALAVIIGKTRLIDNMVLKYN
ncbi:MAG: pantoate--beta-alanine ligase [bacterium]|nr:pantoate--beta-alanine ligase [bacterium]